MQFNPFKENSLVSCGVKQISFWTLIGNTLQKKKGLFGQPDKMSTLFSLAFSKEKFIYYTGTISGKIYVWKENQLEDIRNDAHAGSVFAILALNDGFITGGKDGRIRIWDSNFIALETIDLRTVIEQNGLNGLISSDGNI